jgi:LPS export ABC transporter permease LptG/LPS export ABC transporter permease LptF
MRLINRYLVREIVPYVLLTLVLLTSVIFLREASRFSELFIVFTRSGTPTGPLLRLIAAVLPTIFLYTIPISLLVGTLVGLSRLSSDSEIIALRASGISRRRLMYPLLVIGLVAAGVMSYITFELAPAGQRTLSSLKEARGDIIYQGISTQIKPRVFEESIPGKVFFIRDVDRHTNEWKNIFIAETGTGDPTHDVTVYTARSGRLSSPLPGKLLPEFHLVDAQAHQVRNADERNKVEYNVQDAQKLSIVFQTEEEPAPAEPPPRDFDELDLATLLAQQPSEDRRLAFETERQKRFAIPVTCVIFAVIGLAFGVYNQRSGRSFGLVLGLLLTVVFYVLSIGGEKSARSGALPVWLGIWGPNLAFAAFGLWTTTRGKLPRWAQLGAIVTDLARRVRAAAPEQGPSRRRSTGGTLWSGFPRLVDRLILSDLGRHIAFVVLGMTAIFVVFTIFELLGDIVTNGVAMGVVVGYVLYLMPQIVVYMLPLGVLVAVMVTFGLMAAGSQIVALKASGQSVYRLAVPVLVLALGLSFALFAVQNYVLPTTNRQQEDLRQQILSGTEPARTIYQADRQWLFGKENRIFYYRHYDPATDAFANLSIFELDPETFQITRRTYAAKARWDAGAQKWLLQFGWTRTFDGVEVTSVDAFPSEYVELPETPEYFKRPVSEADMLTFGELRRHVEDLSLSGFDVLDLRIDMHGKLAFPLTCLVMALVGLPFAFSVGKRGAVYGVAIGLVIGLVFWGALGLFTQLGRYEIVPPILAAWGPNLIFGAGGTYLFLTTRT